MNFKENCQKLTSSKKVLVIVPCGKRKVWDKHPTIGAVRAKDAYISPYFKLCKEYAEHFSDGWIILSAKYGFIKPDFIIRRNYDITFKQADGRSILDTELREQVENLKLNRYTTVIVLGGNAYYKRIRKAFGDKNVKIKNPLEGLGIGRRQQKLKTALLKNRGPI